MALPLRIGRSHLWSRQSVITSVLVKDYKSLAGEHEVQLRPLTLLSGANSSGKSSLMQPLLLLKQTVEASFDPGPLLLSDGHVSYTSTNQLIPFSCRDNKSKVVGLGLGLSSDITVRSDFEVLDENELRLWKMEVTDRGGKVVLEAGTTYFEVEKIYEERVKGAQRDFERQALRFAFGIPGRGLDRSDFDQKLAAMNLVVRYQVTSDRCFLNAIARLVPKGGEEKDRQQFLPGTRVFDDGEFAGSLARIIHVPGLRGNPERSYQTSGVGEMFPGTFEVYTASLIRHWQQKDDRRRMEGLCRDLRRVGLTSKIEARQLDASRVELQVSIFPKAARRKDPGLVNIADVGFGVSQTLPVLVALWAAESKQLVYLEQPEIHLHPKAQVALAEVIVDAVNRGVRVVVETHSALLLLGIQTLVANEKIDPEKLLLHWFQRDPKTGITSIDTAEVDEQGRFGDWPVDFLDVEMDAQERYFRAVEERAFGKAPKTKAKKRSGGKG